MSNRTVIRTVITPRAITRRVGPAGAGGGATTFAALTDKATTDLPVINGPLGTALAGKLSITGTAADVNPAGTSIASALSGKQPLDADLTSWAGVTRAAGFDIFTATPSSANLRSLVTDETGTGPLVFGTLPALAGFSTTGSVSFSTGTTFTYGAGIAAAHRTALGLGSLATQNGTFSGDSSGTNTGDQDLSNFLSRRTILEVNGTDAPISQSLVEQGYLSNGRRVWANGDGGTLLYDGASWFLTQLDPDSLVVYDAFKTSGSYEPWLLTGWTVTNGSGEPTFVLDPAEPLGNGVIIALDVPADTNGGFLTAGTGGTLPITRGGTGATTAGLARTALGSGATGDALFTAATPAAARTTLELGAFSTNGSITGPGALTFAAGGSNQNINLTPSGTGLVALGQATVTGSAYPPLDMIRTTAITNALVASSRLTAISSGNISDGFGPTFAFNFSDTGVTNQLAGALGFARAGADNTSDFILQTVNAGTQAEKFRIKANGDATVQGTTASTSTTTGALIVAGGVGVAGAVNSLYQRVGSGTPEGVVTAPIGAVFHRTDGGAGTSFYVKQSGTGNTGWVGK